MAVKVRAIQRGVGPKGSARWRYADGGEWKYSEPPSAEKLAKASATTDRREARINSAAVKLVQQYKLALRGKARDELSSLFKPDGILDFHHFRLDEGDVHRVRSNNEHMKRLRATNFTGIGELAAKYALQKAGHRGANMTPDEYDTLSSSKLRVALHDKITNNDMVPYIRQTAERYIEKAISESKDYDGHARFIAAGSLPRTRRE